MNRPEPSTDARMTRATSRRVAALVLLAAFTAPLVARAEVDAQSHSYRMLGSEGNNGRCYFGVTEYRNNVPGWPSGWRPASIRDIIYVTLQSSNTHPTRGIIRQLASATPYPTRPECAAVRLVEFETTLHFRVTETSEPVDIVWEAAAQADPASRASWTLTQVDASDQVIAGLTIPSTGSLPTSSGVTQPVQDRAGRLQLMLAPGTYAFKSFGRSKSADVSLRTLLSFDTDRDGVTDLAEGCTSDLDANGSVDFGDLSLLLLDMDTAGGPADLDASGVVDLADMALLLQDVGPCPTAP